MEKNYNPFKMQGSWVGAGLLPAYFIFEVFFKYFVGGFEGEPGLTFSKITNFFIELFPIELAGLSVLLLIISFAIPGFLLGWVVHSLFRKFSN